MTDRRPEDEAADGGHWTEGTPAQGEPPSWEQAQEVQEVHEAESYAGQEPEPAETQAAPPPEAAPARRSGLLFVALGLLIAFLAGAAVWPLLGPLVLAQLPPSWGLGATADNTAREAVEQRLASLEERVSTLDALPQRVDELQNRLAQSQAGGEAPLPAVEALTGRVDTLNSELDSLARQVATLSERASSPAPGGAIAATGETAERIAALESRLSDLQARLEAGAGNAESEQQVTQLSERVAALERAQQQTPQVAQRIAALEAQNAQLQQRLQQLDSTVATVAQQSEAARADGRRDAFVLAVSQLREAVGRGGSYQAELEAVRALVPEDQALSEVLAPLAESAEQGIEERMALRARFDEMANKVVQAADMPQQAGWLDRATQRLSSLVSVRRVGEVEGESAEAIVARAEVRLGRGDLAGAVAELERLEGPAAEAASSWLRDARARLAAEAALEALNARAVAMVAG